MNPPMRVFKYNPENVSPIYNVLGIVYMKNGCCKDQPVLITCSYNPSVGKVYSCQCGCGAWCTTGHPTPAGALRDYQTMTNANVPLNDDYQTK